MAKGSLPYIPPQADESAKDAIINQIVDYLNALNQTQTFVDTNGNTVLALSSGAAGFTGIEVKDINGIPLILIGKLPDGTYGMAISKPGIDVTTAFS